ncbi:alpha-(1,3)-fucosyltransferase 10 [Lycorma delicatula]|uniref:alpha-(1,3)-fucosyltransferase 10 n=1 Tax=Lycorma delicatula TaxID=130591 RepID=UPI003F50D68D
MRLIKLFFIIAGIITIVIVIETIIEFYIESKDNEYFDNVLQDLEYTPNSYEILLKEIHDPVVLYWSPLVPEQGTSTNCGNVSCFFTHDRRFQKHPLHKAVILYGSGMNVMDLPLPRKNALWILLQEESPRNFPPLTSNHVLSLFNLTATFSRHSNFPLTLQYLKNTEVITSKKYFVTLSKKNMLVKRLGLATVLYIQSNCNTPSNRDSYVAELMKHIKIDSYGVCLRNKDFPDNLKNIKSGDSEKFMNGDFLNFVAQYKFTIVFENTVCDDYISDKLWRSLIVGSVPIYYGSPTVTDWLPNKNSAILMTDFGSPKALANYLHELNKNDIQYSSYLIHKSNKKYKHKISNMKLVTALNQRKWSIEEVGYIDYFECFVCHSVHNMLKGTQTFNPVTKHHFNCEIPAPLTRNPNNTNWWIEAWRIAGCEALVMNKFTHLNYFNYSKKDFYGALESYYKNNTC